jgi:hypothetical protein
VVREKFLQLLSYLFLDKFKIPTEQTGVTIVRMQVNWQLLVFLVQQLLVVMLEKF